MHRTRHAQPALFVLEYALAQLWLSWGVRPSVVLGHSLGELTAATVAGLFTPADAVKAVAARARLMDSVAASGGMVAVRADADTVRPLVEKYDDLAVAAYNAPRQCVVSGGSASLDEVTAELRARGVTVTARLGGPAALRGGGVPRHRGADRRGTSGSAACGGHGRRGTARGGLPDLEARPPRYRPGSSPS
ncbi:acyltransferase domain-containing protein [Streptomyces sp. NPDC058307]|uniref:acyltransferase domain-containing protein n=1 Tax=Streptomyces sp. NPDC058307 TaxID=3346439 RepID=UPI0036EAA1B9